MKTLKLLAVATVFMFMAACNNNTEEKNRESEVNTDTIDTTSTGSQEMRDTSNVDSSTNTLPPTE